MKRREFITLLGGAAVSGNRAPRQLGLDFPEPQRIHFTLSRFDNGAETLSRPMCAEGVL